MTTSTTELPPPRAHVPLDLDPGVIHGQHAKTMTAGSLGESFLKAAVQVLDTLSLTLHQAHEAKRAVVGAAIGIKGTPAGPVAVADPRTEQALAAALKQSFDRTAALVEQKKAALSEARDRIFAKVDGALSWTKTDYASVQIAAELRSVLRQMSKSDRANYLRQIALSGDVPAVAAVLKAPGILSGVTVEEQQLLWEDTARALVPDDLAQLRAADGILSHLDAASVSWARHMAKAHPKLSPANRRADDAISALAAA
jgi:hypothetical protein